MTTTRVRLVSPTAVTESGDGTAGWNYIGTGTADFSAFQGGPGDVTLAGDGYYYAIVGAIGGSQYTFTHGMNLTGTVTGLSSFSVGIYSNDLIKYKFVDGGTPSASTDNTVVPAAGDWVRVNRVGSAFTVDVSKNSGGSWTTVKALTFSSSAAMTPLLFATSNTQAQVLTIETAGGGSTSPPIRSQGTPFAPLMFY